MSPSTPFVDHDEWTLDLREIVAEAIPLATLIGMVGIVAAIPLAIAIWIGIAPLVMTLLAQFVLAVGAGVVLLYIVARAIHLSDS